MFVYLPQVYPPGIRTTPGCVRQAEKKSQRSCHKVALFDAIFQGLLALRAHFEVQLVGFLLCARPFGSRPVEGKGAVSPSGASALLLEVGAFPGSQHCPSQLLSCHLHVGLGYLPK